MAAPTINFAGFVYDDSGDAVSGATIHIYDKNTTTTAREASSVPTNSDGYYSYSHATPGEFDVEIVKGTSKRRYKFDDKIHLSEIDVEKLSIRGNEGAIAGLYMYADEGDDVTDQWLIDVGTDGVLAFGNDAASQGSFVDQVTFTPNSTVTNGTVAVKGNLTVGNALTVTGTTTLNGNLVLGDAAADTLTIGATLQGASPLTFEGATSGDFETTFAITDPTADRTITFPDLTGTVVLGGVSNGSLAITTTGAADLGATTVDSLTSTGTITGGSDGSGVDVVLYSGTAGDNLTWDASEEQLIITGTNGATSLNVADGNVTIADDLAVDGTSNLDNTDIDGTLVVDGSNISLDSTATLNIDNSNTSNGITIGTATSAVPISIGHTTSETTINDNLTVTGTLDVAGAVVFNEDSADVDFRIESNGNANMFVVDAGDDAIGIGTASTTTGIALRIDGRMFLDDTASNVFVLNSAGSDYGFIMQHSSDKWSLGHGTSITSLGDPVLSWTDTNQVIIDGSLEVNGGAVFNEGSADADFRIESNGNANMFVVDGGSDVVAIGSAVNANYLLTIGGAHTGGSNSFGVRVEPTITGVANNNASIFNVAGTLVEAGSGTHANLWGSAFSTPTVTGGSASVTNTATVWISGAMSAGTNNYALWVDDGVSRFDGDVGIGETSPDTVLHIKDAAPDITLEDSDGGDVYKIGNNGGNYRVRNVTDSRTDLNIEGGGHVGIGTTSASSYHNFADDLVVYSTGNTGITVATNDTSSGRGALYFSDTAHGTNNPQGYITYLHSNNHMYIGTNSNGSASFYLDDNQNVIFAKTVFINETANANMTTGLTINQGAADDQILALKSSDVNHGLTSYASVNTEIDDFAVFSKMTAGTNGGGLRINAIAEDHSSNSEVFQVWASGGQAATGQTVTGTGLIDFVAMEHNGSNARAAITADGNVFTVRAYMDDGGGVGFHTRFLVDEDGDLFADGTLSAYDTFEDAHLVRALDIARGSKDVIKNEWDNFLKYGEEKLVELGILGDTVENGGLVNVTGLQRLHNGAIWQGYTRQMEQEERIKELETRLLALEGGK